MAASPRFEEVIFIENRADNHGGAFYVASGRPVLRNCVFRGNTSGIQGGAVCFFYSESDPRIENCVFEGNRATIIGGGVAFDGSGTPSMTGCVLRGNTAESGGGASVTFGTARIENCSFEENTASLGGALAMDCAEAAKLIDCEIHDNVAALEGGGIRAIASAFALEDCRVVENRCDGMGGAGLLRDTNGTLLGCSVLRNEATEWAGGLFVMGGRLSAVEGEFVGNGLAVSAFETQMDIDARNSYWGHASGPYHPTANPGGLGDEVGDHVLFAPWAATSAVDDRDPAIAPPATRRALAAIPNPSAAGQPVRIVLRDAGGDRSAPAGVRAVLFDVAGRRIRSLDAADRSGSLDDAAGFVWDGRDAHGRVCPPGVYIIGYAGGSVPLVKLP
ncbi:MAG: right-handed parallel beta-helix repeat-containing protein [Candidatus Eisenbacteria bacterium]|nr:right-handed parallel beta-helix repeat-containing protein [Candidatus Eisenbacteria bacterium]